MLGLPRSSAATPRRPVSSINQSGTGPAHVPLPPPPGSVPLASVPTKFSLRTLFGRLRFSPPNFASSSLGVSRWIRIALAVFATLGVAALAVVFLLWPALRSDRPSSSLPTASSAQSTSAVPLATLPLFGLATGASPDQAAIAGTSPTVVAAQTPASTIQRGAANTTPVTIAVHAAGAVFRPGVYLLPIGARVDDVITAAGGINANADPDAINLAARVSDAERIYVPRKGQSVPSVQTGVASDLGAADGGGASTSAAPSVVDLNAANAAQLDSLPGVGPSTASAILEYRRIHGRFRSVAQLLDVPGIGDSKLAALRSRVSVGR